MNDGGQGRISSRSELRRRSRPQGENRPKAIRINRTWFLANGRRYDKAPSRGFVESGGQGRISSRSELRRRSRPQGENRPKAIRINRTWFSATGRRYDKAPSRGFVESGGQGRNRTTDTRIFSPLLYQLSYLAILGLSSSGRGFSVLAYLVASRPRYLAV